MSVAVVFLKEEELPLAFSERRLGVLVVVVVMCVCVCWGGGGGRCTSTSTLLYGRRRAGSGSR